MRASFFCWRCCWRCFLYHIRFQAKHLTHFLLNFLAFIRQSLALSYLISMLVRVERGSFFCWRCFLYLHRLRPQVKTLTHLLLSSLTFIRQSLILYSLIPMLVRVVRASFFCWRCILYLLRPLVKSLKHFILSFLTSTRQSFLFSSIP